MCGFIGLLTDTTTTQTKFDQGLKAIRPRGTTSSIYRQDGEQYGYSRLPTDDVYNQQLELISTSNTKLLYNGLITNVDYLCRKYDLPTEAKKSDALCLRAGLQAHGTAFLSHVRGMFAAAFITEESVTLMRDTIGIKPLYYSYKDGELAFASELKALQPLSDNIYEVLPGQLIVFDKTTRKLSKHSFRYQSYAPASEDSLRNCLEESVLKPTQRYLQNSDKKIALLLSGGLDSSITAAILVQQLPEIERQRLVAFCIGESNSPDVRAATKLATHLELELVHVKPYTAEKSLQALPQIVYATESPYARVIKVGLLYDALAKAINQRHIDVVLGGEGADELFFGYHRFIDGLTHAQSEELFETFFKKVFHYTLLQRYDRIMARHQIEGRVPYLDQELIELAAAIPVESKIQHHPRGHTSKLPLRALAKELGLPAYIYERGKEKMTSGATNKQNEATTGGYLEQEALDATGLSFQHLTQTLYRLHFGNSLAYDGELFTEEQVMQLVRRYKDINKSKQTEGSRV